MGLPCGKRSVTLIWGLLECLFFSGILNGWSWMQQILKEDGYFLDHCNITGLLSEMNGNLPYNLADLEAGFYNRLTTKSHRGIKKCKTVRVTKVIPKKDLKLYRTTTQTPPPEIHNKPLAKPLLNLNITGIFCDEQSDQLELVISLVIILRNILMLPLGLFLDKYGTSRTRLLAMSCSAFGSLLMLFSSDAYPWLIFPALLMLGISGLLVLLTDLQISNMFGPRRYTIMSMFVGSYFSGGIVIFFMKLTKYTGVSLQTSFMFITIGIVPILISTIAMLPRSRIPWPMPADYGKGGLLHDDDKSRKSKPWQRRISVGVKKRQAETSEVFLILKTPLFIYMVLWFAIISLKSLVYDLNMDVLLQKLHNDKVDELLMLGAVMLLLSFPLSPFIGVIMDCSKCKVSGREPHVQQMINILHAVLVTFTVSLLASAMSLVQDAHVQIFTFIFLMIEKVCLHATFFAFLTHVHFPSEHFGKCFGITFAVSGIFCILQYPIKLLIYHSLNNDPFYVNIGLIVLLLLALCHPISLWINCKAGSIENTSAVSEPQKAVTIMLMEKSAEEESFTMQQGEGRDCSGLQVTDL